MIVNVAFTILVGIIAEVLKLKSGSGLAIGACIASSFFAASAFVKDHGRNPTKAEKGTFAWRALCATWLVSLTLTILFLAVFVSAAEVAAFTRALKSGTGLAFGIGAVLFISTIYYIGIRWSFGWYAQMAVKQRDKV